MIACYSIYDNASTLPESLESVLPYVKKIVAVDGAYKNFPHKQPFSTDGTKEIFSNVCGNKVNWVWIGCNKAWPTQILKKNEFLKHVPHGEWWIQIDGDEIITGKVKESFDFVESSTLKCAGMPLHNYYPIWGDDITMGPSIPSEEAWKTLKWKVFKGVARRIYRSCENMAYKNRVMAIYIGDEKIGLDENNGILKDVLLTNLTHKIGWKRYQDKLGWKLKYPNR